MTDRAMTETSDGHEGILKVKMVRWKRGAVRSGSQSLSLNRYLLFMHHGVKVENKVSL